MVVLSCLYFCVVFVCMLFVVYERFWSFFLAAVFLAVSCKSCGCVDLHFADFFCIIRYYGCTELFSFLRCVCLCVFRQIKCRQMTMSGMTQMTVT